MNDLRRQQLEHEAGRMGGVVRHVAGQGCFRLLLGRHHAEVERWHRPRQAAGVEAQPVPVVTSIVRVQDMDIDTGRRDFNLPILLSQEAAEKKGWPTWKKVYKFLC